MREIIDFLKPCASLPPPGREAAAWAAAVGRGRGSHAIVAGVEPVLTVTGQTVEGLTGERGGVTALLLGISVGRRRSGWWCVWRAVIEPRALSARLE